MSYLGDGVAEALSILGNNEVVWKHVSNAEHVKCLAKEQRVMVYGVVREGKASVVKYSTRTRTEQALDQITAENKAAMLLSNYGAHPLLVFPVKTIFDPDVGSFSIAPYAGVSAAEMRKHTWVNLEVSRYDQLCKTFAVSALLTQRLFYGSTNNPLAPGRRRFLHKDIKLQNTCYNAEYNIFRFVDYGAFSSVDQKQWVNCIDLRYLDPQMARYFSELNMFAAEFDAGVKATINPTSDVYQTGLAVVQLFVGHLPAKIDLLQYGGNTHAYLRAVWDFRWDTCTELSTMPALLKDWVLKALAFDPRDRFQSAAEALEHPWLKGALIPVMKGVRQATPAWQQLVQDLKEDLRADHTISSNGGARSTATILRAVSNVPPSSAAVCHSYTGGNIADGAKCSQAYGNQEYEDYEEYEDNQGYKDDEEYGVAQHCQQRFEQYDGDHADRDIADHDSHNSGSTISSTYSKGSCCHAAEAALEHCRSSPSALPPAAGVTGLFESSVKMMSKQCQNSHIAGDHVEDGDTQPAASNFYSFPWMQIPSEERDARADTCMSDSITGAAVSAAFYQRAASMLSPSDIAILLQLKRECGASSAASSSASLAGGSSTASGCGTYAAQWHVDGLDGSNVDQADAYRSVMPTSAAISNVGLSAHQHLVPSACGGSTALNNAAASDPVMRLLEASYHSVFPAPKVDLHDKHVQVLDSGAFNGLCDVVCSCSSGGALPSSSAEEHHTAGVGDIHNVWPGCLSSVRLVSPSRSLTGHYSIQSNHSITTCGGISSAPATCAARLSSKASIITNKSACNTGSIKSQRSSNSLSSSSSGAEHSSKASHLTVMTTATVVSRHQDECLVELEAFHGSKDVLALQSREQVVPIVRNKLVPSTADAALQQSLVSQVNTAEEGQQQDSRPHTGAFQQPSHGEVNCGAEAVQAADNNGSSQAASAAGSRRKVWGGLKFAVGVAVTLLVGWQRNSQKLKC